MRPEDTSHQEDRPSEGRRQNKNSHEACFTASTEVLKPHQRRTQNSRNETPDEGGTPEQPEEEENAEGKSKDYYTSCTSYSCVENHGPEGRQSASGGCEGANHPSSRACQKSSTASTSRSPARRPKKPEGFLLKGQKVSRQKARLLGKLIAERVEEPHEQSRAFLAHLVETGSPWNGYWVPVYSRLIEKEYREPNTEKVWRPLADAGLVEWREADRRKGLSRSFRASTSVRASYQETGPKTLSEASRTGYADLITGRRCRKTAKSKVKDDTGNPYPPLVKGALRTITTSLFHAPSVEAHLEKLQAMWCGAERKWTAAGRPEEGSEHRAFEKASRRFFNDRRCYDAILRQGPSWYRTTTHSGKRAGRGAGFFDGLSTCPVAYRVQMSGRIGQIGGGLQSCTREMKEAAYGAIPGVINYDLKSSQPTILIQLFEEAGIDPAWLESYVSDPEAKHEYAQRTSLSVSAWKRVFCALLMGATLPQDPEQSSGAIAEVIAGDVGRAKLADVHAKVAGAVGPLKKRLDQWHEHLTTGYLEEHGYAGHGGKSYVRNEAGMTFCPEDVRLPHERKAKLAAFLLQGKEAAYIHQLTILSQDYGYRVLANEHDGLVTLGTIPQAARKEAARTANLARSRLAEKDIA